MVEDTLKNVTCLIAQMNVRANFTYQLNESEFFVNFLTALYFFFSHDSFKLLINKNHLVLFHTAGEFKNVIYDIPIDAKTDPSASSCDATKDVLNVKWIEGNSFELIFENKNSTYDLSSFTITLNVSSIFTDSAGSCMKSTGLLHNNRNISF